MKTSACKSTALCLFSLLVLASILAGCSGEQKQAARIRPPDLETFDTGFFSILKPKGWEVTIAGHCTSLAFLLRDPAEPLRQIFYFGQVGPVYLTPQQKQVDAQYMNMGGYPITWYEMPVVQPLTPQHFLESFHLIADTQIARDFIQDCPELRNLRVVSSTPQRSTIQGGQSAIVRAVFEKNARVGEGLFSATVATLIPFSGGPGSGTGQGFMISGITAPREEFPILQARLAETLASFSLDPAYVQDCMRQQQATYAGIMRAGDTLRETSDMIVNSWEERNKTHDILAEKWSDTILTKERLYDPDTGEVYEFESGFFDRYDLDRQRYEMSNLERLPEHDYDLWMKAPRDGEREIH